MKWSIDKSFDFCYGHRVWTQELNAEFSLDGCLACRHLHGHQGQIKVYLESNKLEKGMVTDFKHLNWFKVFLDDALDHKFIMDINDPLLPHEVPELVGYTFNLGTGTGPGTQKILDFDKCDYRDEGYWIPAMRGLDGLPQAIQEKYEGMVFVDFVPTSENLSAWLLGIAQKKMAKMNVKVVAVEFNETPKSHVRVEW